MNIRIPPPFGVDALSSRVVDWAQITGEASITGATSEGVVIFTPHYEEIGRIYESIKFETTVGGSGGLALAGIYDIIGDGSEDSDTPGDLLWTSDEIDTETPGQFTALFESSGAWVSDKYKNTDDRLALPRGAKIWKAWVRNSIATTLRFIPIAAARNLVLTATDWDTDSPITAYAGSITFANGLDDPAAAIPVSTDIPMLPLRWYSA